MTQSIYCLYDVEMNVYGLPFLAPVPKTDIKEAYRRQFFHDPKKAEELHLYCSDLFYLGEFDEVEGEIKLNKEFVMHVRDVLPLLEVKA